MGGASNDMQGGPGVNMFADPMANAAMMYGSSLANQGKDMVNKEVWVKDGVTSVGVSECVVVTPGSCLYNQSHVEGTWGVCQMNSEQFVMWL